MEKLNNIVFKGRAAVEWSSFSVEEYKNNLIKCVDELAAIKNKCDYTDDYEAGYKDAVTAIKNTAETLFKLLEDGKNENQTVNN